MNSDYIHDMSKVHNVALSNSGAGNISKFTPVPAQVPAMPRDQLRQCNDQHLHQDPHPLLAWHQGAAAPSAAAAGHSGASPFGDLISSGQPSLWADPTAIDASSPHHGISRELQGRTYVGHQMVWPEGGCSGGGAVDSVSKSGLSLDAAPTGGGGGGGGASLSAGRMSEDGQTGLDIIEAFQGLPELMKWVAGEISRRDEDF
jgi:hypothetical protein